MFYISRPVLFQEVQPYVETDIETWLAMLYNPQPTAPVPQASPYVEHTEGFTHTRTERAEYPQPYMVRHIDLCIEELKTIGAAIDAFPNTDNMQEHYQTFHIPKHSGGMRRIDAPEEPLKDLMRNIKRSIDTKFGKHYHDAAYAYVSGRSTKDAMRAHQKNNSRWFLKLDMKDFFTSCSEAFILQQLQKVYPYSILMADPESNVTITKLVKLCMLNGGLPQGTPLSPLITNLIMVPIDFKITQYCCERQMVYTRYADDLTISSEYDFQWTPVCAAVRAILTEEGAPFTINNTKTRYGSSAGRNWNLGLMLNKDNKITIGHKQKMRLRAGINNFLRDFTNGIFWSTIELQQLLGNLSYLKNIEPAYTEYIVHELEQKYHLNMNLCAKRILNN